ASRTSGQQDGKGGQVLVLAPQAIAQPGTYTGPPGLLRSRLEKGYGGIVVYGLGIHRFYDTKIIYHFGRIREQLAYIGAIITVPLEIEQGSHQGKIVLSGGHAG